MWETFDPVAFRPNGPQDARGHSLSPLAVCFPVVSAASVLRDFKPKPCLSAGADIPANMSSRSGPKCAPADHLTAEHDTFHVWEQRSRRQDVCAVIVCVCFLTREAVKCLCFPRCQWKGRTTWWMFEARKGWGSERVRRTVYVWLMGVDWWLASVWKALCSRLWVKGQTWDTCG